MLRTLASSLLLPLLLLAPAAARADDVAADCADATTCGRQLFEAGTAAFEKGDYAAAVTRFEAALAQRPHPVIRFNLALSLARLGRPSAALLELSQVLSDPSAGKDLKERADRERRSAEQAQARITFRLSDPSRERVELDGNLVDLSGKQELAADPGEHHVRIISNSSLVLDQDLDLSPGERLELRVGERSRRIDVVVVPTAPPAPVARPVPSPAPPAPAPPAHGLSPVWFYSGLGATAVFTGLTVWSGLDTKHAYSDYQRDLPSLDQAQADERVRNGHARELRTNLLLTGSLLCGAGSAVLGLWFVDFSSKRSASVAVSADRVTLSGRF
ncbi:MAG TPA: tetratricopeptide repeat protein [Polyangiaceae bacterium]|nr:tetratricopeptide repeat protein [Polyangiaceae bacterium]